MIEHIIKNNSVSVIKRYIREGIYGLTLAQAIGHTQTFGMPQPTNMA